MRQLLPSFVLVWIAACAERVDDSLSEPAPPTSLFDQEPPDVVEGWPCPPFDIETTRDQVGDRDGDTLTDCQESALGSDPADADTDGDGVGDFREVGEVSNPRDTDADGLPDLVDTDDDGDGCSTLDEDPDRNGDPTNDDTDADGVPDYLDPDTTDC